MKSYLIDFIAGCGMFVIYCFMYDIYNLAKRISKEKRDKKKNV